MSLILLFLGPAEDPSHALLMEAGEQRRARANIEASEGLGWNRRVILPLCHQPKSRGPPDQVVGMRPGQGCGCREGEELGPLMQSATGHHEVERGSIL